MTERQPKILACITIDDPLLSPNYGCLNYQNLLNVLIQYNAYAQIGYIPYNFNRNNTTTVDLFLNNTKYLGLCVHGCNHTKHEFGKGSVEALIELASTAVWRMEELKKSTGLSYDRVMVFPQNRFCLEAIEALKRSGYQSAFNTANTATNAQPLPHGKSDESLTFAYSNFPCFLRLKCSDRDQMKANIKDGMPIVLGLHHTDFCSGYTALAELIEWLNSLGEIQWCSLAAITHHYAGKQGYNKIATLPPAMFKINRLSRLRIFGRRILTEWRDNYLQNKKRLE